MRSRTSHTPPQAGMPPVEMPPAEALTVIMLINETSKLFFDRMRSESEQIGIRRGYHPFLYHLSRRDDLTQLDLTCLTRLKAPTVSVTLRKMEAEGLVRRETDPADQRQTRVSLTDSGRVMDSRLRRKLEETEALFTGGIAPETLEELRQGLLALRRNILDSGRSPLS